jgi:hypothetical protein
MNRVTVASFIDELGKIAERTSPNYISMTTPKPAMGGHGSNVTARPLPTPGFGPVSASAKPAKSTNYSIVNSTAPTAEADAGTNPAAPPPVRT